MIGDWREFHYEGLPNCEPFTKHSWNGEIKVDEDEEL
jgi:hypothetical protein